MAARLIRSSNDAFPSGVSDDQAVVRELRGALLHDTGEISKPLLSISWFRKKRGSTEWRIVPFRSPRKARLTGRLPFQHHAAGLCRMIHIGYLTGAALIAQELANDHHIPGRGVSHNDPQKQNIRVFKHYSDDHRQDPEEDKRHDRSDQILRLFQRDKAGAVRIIRRPHDPEFDILEMMRREKAPEESMDQLMDDDQHDIADQEKPRIKTAKPGRAVHKKISPVPDDKQRDQQQYGKDIGLFYVYRQIMAQIPLCLLLFDDALKALEPVLLGIR